jgi:hypothetical protein
MTKAERKKHSKLRKRLAGLNNALFTENKAAITKDYKVLPYLVDQDLEARPVQPNWVIQGQFDNFQYQEGSQKVRERLFRLFCGKGYILTDPYQQPNGPRCVLMHHNDPYLKLGPFMTQVVSKYPYRALFHNVSELFIFYKIQNTLTMPFLK